MKYSQLHDMSPAELQRRLQQLREQLRDRRFQVAQGQLTDVREIRELRQDIARLLTRLGQTQPSATPKS
ncbi:MAG: 50S ribosomal protein L29 [Candidatus Kerfeldbacteria bacterium]|nr:50S ribosomal protein L29 [Candidatus Kerfeldbacteria bacterium]